MIFNEIFKRERRQKREEDSEDVSIISKKWAIQYKQLSTPIAHQEDHPTTLAKLTCNSFELDAKDISELWTVIEYIGNREYRDMLTGEIFAIQVLEDDIMDTVTPEYEEAAREREQSLRNHPLAIGSNYGLSYLPQMKKVDETIVRTIEAESFPRKKEIINTIEEMKAQSQLMITAFYQRKNAKAEKKQQQLAEQRRAEEERKKSQDNAAAELERMKREQMAREVKINKMLDELFGTKVPENGINKKLVRK